MFFHNILQKNPKELFGQPIVYKTHYIQIFNYNHPAYFGLAELIHLITASVCPLTILSPLLSHPLPPASATLLSVLRVQLVGSFWNLLSSPASVAFHTSAFSVGLMPPWGVLYPLPITISILEMSRGKIVTC